MPTPQRLPIVNGDDGQWGDILNQYIKKEHYDDGTDNPVSGGHKTITVRAGTATAGTAPLKFTSGTLLTTAEAGAMEFLTDSLYFTITTGAVRKTIAMYDDSSGATGDTYYRSSGGAFTRLAIGGTDNVLKVTGGLPAWSASTGTGSAVLATSPALVTPAIGAATGASLVLSSFLNEAQGADIASATTTDIGAATGNYVQVTGTTTITGLGTVQAGTRRIVKFTGALTLTHNATSLILPGGVSITTVAGDTAEFVSLGSGNWICTSYQKVTITGTGSAVLATSPTLTTPVISSISNTGTLTLPTSTDTLVGRATTDTLTNKSIDASQLTGTVATARLGTGTANSDSYLQGDQTYQKRTKVYLSSAGAAAWSSGLTTPTTILASAFSFAANDLAVGDLVIIEASWYFTQNSGATATMLTTSKLNSVNGINYTSTALAAGSNPHECFYRQVIRIHGTTSCRQTVTLDITAAGGGAYTDSVAFGNGIPTNLLANITNSTNTFDIQVSSSTTTATQTFTPEFIIIYKIPNN